MITQVVNLYGGPGIGKSTLAAKLKVAFAELGRSSELPGEYAKDWAYEGRSIGRYDQVYITGKQMRRESRLYGEQPYLFAESPLWISGFYEEHNCATDLSSTMVEKFIQLTNLSVVRHEFFLPRIYKYDENGRFQKEAEAREIDELMMKYLEDKGVKFIMLPENPRMHIPAILDALGI